MPNDRYRVLVAWALLGAVFGLYAGLITHADAAVLYNNSGVSGATFSGYSYGVPISFPNPADTYAEFNSNTAAGLSTVQVDNMAYIEVKLAPGATMPTGQDIQLWRNGRSDSLGQSCVATTSSATIVTGSIYVMRLAGCGTGNFTAVEFPTNSFDSSAGNIGNTYSSANLFVSAGSPAYLICDAGGCPSGGFTGTSPGTIIDWSAITTPPPFTLGTSSDAIAASSSLWGSLALASTTLQMSCGTESVSDPASYISVGLCQVGSYLFVPSPGILSSYADLPTVVQTKVPFSWFYALQSTYGQLSASSTDNMADVVIPFASTGIGSTTAMGEILPNVTLLSSSTIATYLPNPLRATVLDIESAAIWILFAYFIYDDVTKRNRILKQ